MKRRQAGSNQLAAAGRSKAETRCVAGKQKRAGWSLAGWSVPQAGRPGSTVLRTERRLIPPYQGTVPMAVAEAELEPGVPAAGSSLTLSQVGTQFLRPIEDNELDGHLVVAQLSSQQPLDVAGQPFLHPVHGKLISQDDTRLSVFDTQ